MKTLLASMGILAGLAVFAVANSSEPDLRQVQCQLLIIYTPMTSMSDHDVCSSFGGVATADNLAERPSLTILVKNMPVGGSDGLNATTLQ